MNWIEIIKNLNEDFAVATVIWAKSGSEITVGDKLCLTSSGKIYGDFKSATEETIENLKKSIEIGKPFLMDYTSCDAKDDATCGTKFRAFIEFYGDFPRVHIFGAGDIGIFTHKVLLSLGFNSLIYDSEEPKEKQEKFNLIDYKDIKINIREKDYIVIVTRGHKNDFDVLKLVFDLPYVPKYVGLLGSKAKNEILKDELFEKGYTIKYWERIRTPIGLEIINAKTPKEIALAIAAEIVSIKNGGAL